MIAQLHSELNNGIRARIEMRMNAEDLARALYKYRFGPQDSVEAWQEMIAAHDKWLANYRICNGSEPKDY